MRAEELSKPAADRINERLDAIANILVRLGGIDKQMAAPRLEVQSWKACQDDVLQSLIDRVDELEAAIAGGEGG